MCETENGCTESVAITLDEYIMRAVQETAQQGHENGVHSACVRPTERIERGLRVALMSHAWALRRGTLDESEL